MVYDEGAETLSCVAQTGCGCPMLGNIQGRFGWGSEKPDLIEDVSAHDQVVGSGDL